MIEQNSFKDDTKTSTDLMGQMLGILNYLNKNNIMHRNFNPDCFLVDRNLNKLVIFDLSTCCFIDDKLDRPVTNILFSSPEIFKKDTF